MIYKPEPLILLRFQAAAAISRHTIGSSEPFDRETMEGSARAIVGMRWVRSLMISTPYVDKDTVLIWRERELGSNSLGV